jgi:hypothetical protein
MALTPAGELGEVVCAAKNCRCEEIEVPMVFMVGYP